jgi:hypothetical protein
MMKRIFPMVEHQDSLGWRMCRWMDEVDVEGGDSISFVDVILA